MNFSLSFYPALLLGFYVFTSSVVTAQLNTCNQVPMSPTERVVTDKNDKGQIELSVGSILVVKLPSTPGIGYTWYVSTNDVAKLQLVGDPQLEPVEAEAPGAIENQVFRFAAKAPGRSVLELIYIRPWEQKAPPLKTYRLNLQIK